MKSQSRPYIVVTRPEPGLTETVERVEKMGWGVLPLPLMQVQPILVELPDMSFVQAIVFTSRQAVPLAVKQFVMCRKEYQHIPVFTVGDMTAKDAEKAGFSRVFSAHKDALALGELLCHSLDPAKGKILFFSGQNQGRDLVTFLHECSFKVIQQEVYKTIAVEILLDDFWEKLYKQQIHSILFFSTETARIFVTIIKNRIKNKEADFFKSVRAIGISKKVQEILKILPWQEIYIADLPNADAMLFHLKEQ